VCLLDQKFLLDDALSVSQLLQQRAKALLGGGAAAGGLRVAGFVRVQVGEGLEQQAAKSFADEVAEMAGGGS
jgi:translation elongation factor EF-Ts